MEYENPFRTLGIRLLDGLTLDIVTYVFLLLLAVLIFAIKEKLIFMVIVDVFFVLVLVAVIIYKWGY